MEPSRMPPKSRPTFHRQIRKSPQAQAFFQNSCEEEDLPTLELLQWVRTRWASLFKCLERFIALRPAVTRFTNLADESPEVPKLRNKKYQDFKLDRADWKRLQLVYNVLKEPATAQQTFSSAKHPTAWRTIPTLECLANRWRLMASDPQYTPIADAIQQGLKNVEKYYKETSESDVYFICLVLDPNYKLAYVEGKWSPEELESGVAAFDKYYQPPVSRGQGLTPAVSQIQEAHYGEAWMREMIAARQNNRARHDPRDELNAYLSSSLEVVADIIAWWGIHSLQYPTLSRIARDYLPIQGSAVPSEQAFSSGGITSTIHRNSLMPSTFSALQLLKAEYKNGHVSAVSEAARQADLLADLS